MIQESESMVLDVALFLYKRQTLLSPEGSANESPWNVFTKYEEMLPNLPLCKPNGGEKEKYFLFFCLLHVIIHFCI